LNLRRARFPISESPAAEQVESAPGHAQLAEMREKIEKKK
jgi:hypothetical protein